MTPNQKGEKIGRNISAAGYFQLALRRYRLLDAEHDEVQRFYFDTLRGEALLKNFDSRARSARPDLDPPWRGNT